LRKVGQLIHAGAGGKPVEFDKFWPSGVKKQELVFSKEEIEQIKKRHGVK